MQVEIRNELKIHLFWIHFTPFEFSSSHKAHQGNVLQSGERLYYAETEPFSSKPNKALKLYNVISIESYLEAKLRRLKLDIVKCDYQ